MAIAPMNDLKDDGVTPAVAAISHALLLTLPGLNGNLRLRCL
ncbi:MAG: hypothetical protein V3R37_02150 [Rhodospirillales bacterium]